MLSQPPAACYLPPSRPLYLLRCWGCGPLACLNWQLRGMQCWLVLAAPSITLTLLSGAEV